MNMNESFGEEYDKLVENSNMIWNCCLEIKNTINDTPKSDNLVVMCQDLEAKYTELGEYTNLLGESFFKLSQLYHCAKLVNEVYLEKSDDKIT